MPSYQGDRNAAASASISVVVASAQSQQALGINPFRSSLIIQNDANGPAYVAFASATASLSAYTLKILPSGSYQSIDKVYYGPVFVTFQSGTTGSCYFTELYS